MIICIIGYVVLLFLVLQKQKRKIFVRCEEKSKGIHHRRPKKFSNE